MHSCMALRVLTVTELLNVKRYLIGIIYEKLSYGLRLHPVRLLLALNFIKRI